MPKAERWLPVPGWPYEVSDLGRVRSVDRVLRDGRQAGGVVLQATPDGKGYPCVTLRGGVHRWTVRVHRLVKLVHTGPARGRQVRHVDDVKTDTRLSKLKYGTQKQNEKDKERNRRRRERQERGERRGGKRERNDEEKQLKQAEGSRVTIIVAPGGSEDGR